MGVMHQPSNLLQSPHLIQSKPLIQQDASSAPYPMFAGEFTGAPYAEFAYGDFANLRSAVANTKRGAASFAPSKGAVFDFQLSRGSKSNKLSRSRTWVPHTRFMRVGIVAWDRLGLAFDLALDFDIA
jgi:hypothetical protein